MAGIAEQVTVLEDLRRAQRANGSAAVLAIGTATPANCVLQDQFPDWYFRVTGSDHLTELKTKMKRICDKSGIKKRYFHHTEERISRHPEILDRVRPSLGARLRATADAVPELAAVAAATAIAEWGRSSSDITHLVVATNSGADEPGADHRLAVLLGLRPTVRRTLLYLHSCSAGLVAMRVAKDIAENNRGARVLVACAHAALLSFGAPDEARLGALVTTALFADGAGAVIVGSDPTLPVERPLFHFVSSSQATVPATERTVGISLSESGVEYGVSMEVPVLVRDNIERCLADSLSLAPLGLANARDGGGGFDWNSVFWAVHPGGPALLDSYEAALGLDAVKLTASRHVLAEHGNMLGATVIFVLDEIRRRRQDGGAPSEDSKWGIVSGLGPGLTVETIVLHAAGSRNED